MWPTFSSSGCVPVVWSAIRSYLAHRDNFRFARYAVSNHIGKASNDELLAFDDFKSIASADFATRIGTSAVD